MDGFWELNHMDKKNPSHTGQFLNSYDQREFTEEEVIAREGGQNAMDAGRKTKGITELEFHELKISGSKKEELIELIKLRELLEPRMKVFKSNPRQEYFASKVESFLGDEEVSALLIRDKNTCGLGGAQDEYEKGDHFARLVCALNLDDKADDDPNSGGSFGLGKTAYAKSSLINTVLYHSTFKATDRTNQTARRLMVAGVYPQHKFENQKFGGFAYFGKQDDSNPKEAVPYVDGEAEVIWTKVMGLFERDLKRSETEHGTDILIFMTSLDLEKIKKACEDYYFPALIDQKVNIKFYDIDGQSSLPKPYQRKDLDQFVRLMQEAKKAIKNTTDDKKIVDSFQRINDHNVGTFAFEAAEIDEAGSNKSNCVAIMRGTGMIINYVKLGSEQYEPAVGAFVAHENIHKYLVSSENAAHSEWNPNSRRLQQDYPEHGVKIVTAVNNRLHNRFNLFQKQLQPDVTASRSETGFLSRLLSGALGGTLGNDGIERGGPNPAAISLTKKKREEHRSLWRLVVSSNEHTPEEEFELSLFPTISLAGDAKLIPIKHMDLHVCDTEGKVKGRGSKIEIQYKFKRGEVIDLLVSYDDPGSKNYVVNCKCVAQLEEANDQ